MEPENMCFSPENLAKLIQLVDNGTINRTVGKEVFERIFADNVNPEQYVEEKGLKVVNDEGQLREAIQGIIDANPQSVEDYHNGKEKAMGFLVGQTMRAMKGKADPASVNRIVKELLG
jgi:aspartyl-tRNA(Asn)/glutamyl-tRNA(Gln) amidotransferase subunit B